MKNKGQYSYLNFYKIKISKIWKEKISFFSYKTKKPISNDPKQTWIDHVILDN
jgi:hypothetical protein